MPGGELTTPAHLESGVGQDLVIGPVSPRQVPARGNPVLGPERGLPFIQGGRERSLPVVLTRRWPGRPAQCQVPARLEPAEDPASDQIARCGVRFSACKVISDATGTRLPPIARFVGGDGRFHAGRFLAHVSIRPWLWLSVQRLAQDSKVASGKLCEALKRVTQAYSEEQSPVVAK